MATISNGSVEKKDEPRVTKKIDKRIPYWITEDDFLDIIAENEPGFQRIVNFDVSVTGGNGENYASVMLRVQIKVELLYGVIRDFVFMLKTLPPGEQAQAMINALGLFPKETAMYSKYIPEFEKMYLEVGKRITFAPKYYRLKNDPGVAYILLDDLSPKGFKNEDRLVGINIEQTESALKLLAAFHAASAVRRETKGEYDTVISKPMFTEEQRPMIEAIGKSLNGIFIESLKKYKDCAKYMDKIQKIVDSTTDQLIKFSIPDPNDFNVVLHGDLWVNNILFRNNDEGKLEETTFIDFQISRCGTPSMDLYYFLLSSTNYDIKISQFDNFIKYYHNHLADNLKLLRYSKNIPTLKDLRLDLLHKSFFGLKTLISVMAVVLLEPSKEADMESFIKDGADERAMKMKMFLNPRYVKHMEALLPWLDMRGLLD